MHDDVGVTADGGREVGVEGHVQGVVVKEGLVSQDAGAEVESHLKGGETRQGCEQGWCREAGGVWLCETQRQQPMALLKTSCLLVVLHLLLSLGCTGTAETKHRIKGAKPLPGAAGCQLSLPGPKDCINLHITHGSKQLPASVQALGLTCLPLIFQGRAQLVLCPHQMLFGSGSGCRLYTSTVQAWRALGAGMSGFQGGERALLLSLLLHPTMTAEELSG